LSRRGTFFCSCDLRLWAVLRQLPERVYLPIAARPVGHKAAVRMPALRRFDPALPQRARTELADSAGKVPDLQAAHLATLHGDRDTDGLALSWLLSPFWFHIGDVEVRCARLPAAGIGFHRCGNQAS